MKKKNTQGERVFVSYVLDRVLIFIIYKEIKNKSQENKWPSSKWAMNMNKELSKDKIAKDTF